jgi:hypothetical protein
LGNLVNPFQHRGSKAIQGGLRKAITQSHAQCAIIVESSFARPATYDMQGDVLHLVRLKLSVVERA